MEDFDQYDEFGRGGIARSGDPAERKSPSVSATAYSVGTQMEGNDGNMWEVVADKNGVQRWKKVGKGSVKVPVTTPLYSVNNYFIFSAKKYRANSILQIWDDGVEFEYWDLDNGTFVTDTINKKMFDEMVQSGEVIILPPVSELLEVGQYFYDDKGYLCKYERYDSPNIVCSFFEKGISVEIKYIIYNYNSTLVSYLFTSGEWKRLEPKAGDVYFSRDDSSIWEKIEVESVDGDKATYTLYFRDGNKRTDKDNDLLKDRLHTANAELRKPQTKPDIKVDKGDQFVDKRYPNLIGTITDIENKVVKFDTFNVEDDSSVIGVEMDENTFIDKLVLGDIIVLSAKIDLKVGDYFYNIEGTLCKVKSLSDDDYIQVDYFGEDGYPRKRYVIYRNAKVRSYLLESGLWKILQLNLRDIFTSRVDKTDWEYVEILNNVEIDNKVIYNIYNKDKSVEEFVEDSLTAFKEMLWLTNSTLKVDAQPKTPFIVPDDLQKSPNQKIAEFLDKNAVEIGKLTSDNPALGKLVTDTLSFLNQRFSGKQTVAEADKKVDKIQRDAVQSVTQSKVKVMVKEIKITMAEGSGSVKGRTFTRWDNFNESLKEVYDDWAKGGSTGYNKVFFSVTWQDGNESPNERIDINDKNYNPYNPKLDPETKAVTFYEFFKKSHPYWTGIDAYSFSDMDIFSIPLDDTQQAVQDELEVDEATIDIAEQIEDLEEQLKNAKTQDEKDYLQGLIDDLNISLNFM